LTCWILTSCRSDGSTIDARTLELWSGRLNRKAEAEAEADCFERQNSAEVVLNSILESTIDEQRAGEIL
jgi:hypothetical protein